MQKRKLGRSDLQVSPLAFGGNVFGWTADEATSFRLLDRFVDEGFNFIDLYQSHADDAQTPLADTLGAYDKLIRAGKVRVIGASNYSAERFEESLAVSKRKKLPRYESIQPNYNLIDRADRQRDVIAAT